MNAAQARAVLDAAVAQADGTPMSVAVVDAAGDLMAFLRMDGAHLGTIEIAIAKARCAARFRRPTRRFAEAFVAGGGALASLPGVTPFSGGVPLLEAGVVVGGVGASGASPDQDERVATAGASSGRI